MISNLKLVGIVKMSTNDSIPRTLSSNNNMHGLLLQDVYESLSAGQHHAENKALRRRAEEQQEAVDGTVVAAGPAHCRVPLQYGDRLVVRQQLGRSDPDAARQLGGRLHVDHFGVRRFARLDLSQQKVRVTPGHRTG